MTIVLDLSRSSLIFFVSCIVLFSHEGVRLANMGESDIITQMIERLNLPSVTPEAYLKPVLPESKLLPKDELQRRCVEIAERFRGLGHPEITSYPMTDDEKLVLTSLLKFVDYCMPIRARGFRGRSASPLVRKCIAASINVMGMDFADLDIEDLRQNSRLAVIGKIRRYDPDRSPSPLTTVPFGIHNAIVRSAGKSVAYGFGTRSRGSRAQNRTSDAMISRLRNEVFFYHIENGWSEHLEELHNQPEYKETQPLQSVHESPEDEYEERVLPLDDRPTVPRQDMVLPSVDVVMEVEAKTRLDRAIDLVEQCGVNLSERDKMVLRLRYERDMTLEAVGERVNVTSQRVSQIIDRIFGRIRENPFAVVALHDLAAF